VDSAWQVYTNASKESSAENYIDACWKMYENALGKAWLAGWPATEAEKDGLSEK
jgi:hypothetical protein